MEDVRAVMDAVGCERAAVCGISEGGPLAALFAATYPDRTAALIFYGSVVKWLAAEDFPWGLPAEVLDLMTDFADHNFGTGPPLEFWAPSVAGNPSLQQWWAESERLSSSPGAMKAQLEMNRRIDVRPILPSINVPTLVLHRADDVIINVGQGRYLAEQIPGAKYVELAGADHIPFYGDSDSVVEEIEEFLTGTRHAAPADRVLSTVLFTDIVGSTELAARLGDASWRHLLDRHDVIARREVERWRGRPVKSTGDGVLATFDGPARAIRCAAGLRDALGAEDIAIRAGVHTGEIELRGEDVGGIAVHIAARVESHAEPGEVLVSRTVTDLVAGSGIEFVDRGTHVLKGVPGSSQLLAVASV
jgi:class 3 adenylate cyclase